MRYGSNDRYKLIPSVGKHMNKPVQTNLRASAGRLLFLSTLVCGLAACNGGNDNFAPSVTLSASGSSLDLVNPITVMFSESMDTSSLRLGGTLTEETDGGVWSTTNVPNDTLTISPATGSWSGGATRTLTVDARDVAGNPAPTINKTYQVAPLALNNFQAAEVVIGQPDFTSNLYNQNGPAGANTLVDQFGNALVTPDGTLFIGDYSNDRILAFAQIPTTNNANASFVLGQPDFTSTVQSVNRSSHDGPQQIVMHDGKMIVANYAANRILIYNAIPNDGSDQPDVVVGQPDFTSNGSACDADSLNRPETVAVTPDGRLLVADGQNHRVLIWNSIPTVNGQAADVVIGQSNFTQCTNNDDDQNSIADAAPTTRTLNAPGGLWTDGARLVIGDPNNNRVLILNSIPTTNFQPADLVLGQGSFTRNAANDDTQDGVTDMATARTMSSPYAGIHSNGTQLAVTDAGNNRVLIWNTFPTASFQPADVVLGQSNFMQSTSNDDDQNNASDTGASARVFNFPAGVLFYRDRLLVSDAFNSRMLIFRSN